MTTTRWQVQEATNRLSEVVRKARDEGPQVITLRGDEALVDAEQYRQLSQRPKGNVVEFLRRSPLIGVDLDVTRGRDTGRDLTF